MFKEKRERKEEGQLSGAPFNDFMNHMNNCTQEFFNTAVADYETILVLYTQYDQLMNGLVTLSSTYEENNESDLAGLGLYLKYQRM